MRWRRGRRFTIRKMRRLCLSTRDCFRNQLLRFCCIPPTDDLYPLARLKILIVFKEMLDLLQRNFRQVRVVHNMFLALSQFGHRYRNHLLVSARLVLHLEHTNGPDIDNCTGYDRPSVGYQHINRITVIR